MKLARRLLRTLSEIRTKSSSLKGNAMSTLATFENAYRLAGQLSDLDGATIVIVATGNIHQPHRVERAAGQANAIAYIASADAQIGLTPALAS